MMPDSPRVHEKPELAVSGNTPDTLPWIPPGKAKETYQSLFLVSCNLHSKNAVFICL